MMNYTACTRSSAARNWLRNTEINTHQPRIGSWICICTSFAWVFLVVLSSQMMAEFISGLFLIFLPYFWGFVTHFWGDASSPATSFHFQMSFGMWFPVPAFAFQFITVKDRLDFFCLREVRIYLGIFSYLLAFNCPTSCWWRLKVIKGKQGFFLTISITFLLSPWVQTPDSSHLLGGGDFPLKQSLCKSCAYISKLFLSLCRFSVWI